MPFKDSTCIVGIGETPVGKLPGRTPLSFELEAARLAIEDSGLKKSDIDGLIVRTPIAKPIHDYCTILAQKLGMQPTFATDVGTMGATPTTMVQAAAAIVHAGIADYILCTYGRSNRSGEGPPRGGGGGDSADYSIPYGHGGAAGGYAFAARRHMHEYGTTSEQLAEIAISTRAHAVANPAAYMKTPITLEDHQSSRWIAEPFHLLDVCLQSDGGGAFIITTAERARDLPKRPIYIMGTGAHFPFGDIVQAPSMTTLGGKVSSEKAFKMAGITAKDIDFAELYDSFTYTVLVQLEDYGFCKKGEGGPFVEGGRIGPGGELPVNTHGGLLSCAHVECMLHIIEAVRQLRNDGSVGARQLKDATIGLVTGNGGILQTHNSLILRN